MKNNLITKEQKTEYVNENINGTFEVAYQFTLQDKKQINKIHKSLTKHEKNR